MRRTYTTLEGEQLELQSRSSEIDAFVERAIAAGDDPAVSSTQLSALVFGLENPLLDKTAIPGRAAVTRAVFEDPLYRLFTDLVTRKHVAEATAEAADPGVLSLAQAAKELGVTPAALRKAIYDGRLEATKVGAAHVTSREALERFAAERAPRGPKKGPALVITGGNAPGYSLRWKAPEAATVRKEKGPHKVVVAEVDEFEEVAVILTDKSDVPVRTLVLVPAARKATITHGPFSVVGKFKTREVTSGTEAQRVWRAFEAR